MEHVIYPNRLQRIVAIRRKWIVYLHVACIACLTLLLFTVSQPAGATCIGYCPVSTIADCPDPTATINSVLGTGTGSWFYHVGQETVSAGGTKYHGLCILSIAMPQYVNTGYQIDKYAGSYNWSAVNKVKYTGATSLHNYICSGTGCVRDATCDSFTCGYDFQMNSIHTEPNLNLCQTMASSQNIYSDSSQTTYYGSTGTVNANTLFCSGQGLHPLTPTWKHPTVTLSAVPNNPIIDQTVTFTVKWNNLKFSPWSIYFFEDYGLNQTSYQTITSGTNIEQWINYPNLSYPTGSGSYTFTHSFLDQTYGASLPTGVVLGNSTCTRPIGGSCSGSGYATTNVVVRDSTNINTLYSVSLDFSKYDYVPPDYPDYYQYTIDPALCSGSTISGKRIFHGYSNLSPMNLLDSGAVLSTNLGDGYMSFNEQNNTTEAYPYIKVWCSNGSYSQIFAGGAISLNGGHQSKTAFSIGIRMKDNLIPETYLAGGQSANFTQSGSYLFQAEKHVYSIQEPVRIKYQFFPLSQFGTTHEVRIYPGDQISNSNYYYTSLTDSDVKTTPKMPHYYQFSYSKEGTFQPYIQIVSTSGSVVQFWLGGGQDQNSADWLAVQNITSDFSVLSGTGAGIFGLGSSIFHISFGNSNNVAVASMESIVNYLLQGVTYLASIAFNIIQKAPIFSTVINTVHPPAGSTYILPTEIFGINMPVFASSQSFTISYASGDTSSTVYKLLFALMALGFIPYLIRHIL